MTRLSRRAFAGTSSAALLVLLTACSSSEGETDDSGAAGSSDSGGATGADGAITVEHAFGTTEIPAAPERITTVAWDRKSTRLNSSHVATAYAVCCWHRTYRHRRAA